MGGLEPGFYGIDYREIDNKFKIGSSTACKKVNTVSTGENLFRLVAVLGDPWTRCPSATSGARAHARA